MTAKHYRLALDDVEALRWADAPGTLSAFEALTGRSVVVLPGGLLDIDGFGQVEKGRWVVVSRRKHLIQTMADDEFRRTYEELHP